MPVTTEHLLSRIYHLYADGFRSKAEVVASELLSR